MLFTHSHILLKVYLLAEGVKRCGNRYYLVDVNKSINENLVKKTVVEYPCFYVSLTSNKEQWQNLDLIGNEENIEQEVSEHYQELNELRKGFLEKYGTAQIKENKKDEQSNDESEDNNNYQQFSNKVLEKTEENENQVDYTEEMNSEKTIEHKRIEKSGKAEEYYKTTNNFLFTDDNLLDILSSSEEETDK